MAEGDNGGSPNTSPYALYGLLGIVVLATAVFWFSISRAGSAAASSLRRLALLSLFLGPWAVPISASR